MPKVHIHVHTGDTAVYFEASKATISRVKQHAAQLHVPRKDHLHEAEEAIDDLYQLISIAQKAIEQLGKVG